MRPVFVIAAATVLGAFGLPAAAQEKAGPAVEIRLKSVNDLLDHWVRQVYHQRVHTETGQSPQARHEAAGPAAPPDAALLREAFSWSAVRLVRKTATVALEGNVYSVDPFLVGRKVELVFDPSDLTRVTV